jgi:hypothetical protein
MMFTEMYLVTRPGKNMLGMSVYGTGTGTPGPVKCQQIF